MKPPPTTFCRRDFLITCARYPALAGLAALGAVLITRETQPGAVEPCIKARVCRECRLFDGCGEPQAIQTRKAS